MRLFTCTGTILLAVRIIHARRRLLEWDGDDKKENVCLSDRFVVRKRVE